MIEIIHPCGHTEQIDRLYLEQNEGDVPGGCSVCSEARAREHRADLPMLDPLYEYLRVVARTTINEDSPQPLVDQLCSERTAAAKLALASIERGIHTRVRQLLPSWSRAQQDIPVSKEPLSLTSFLDDLASAYDRTHDRLWCAENMLDAGEMSRAFWLFGFDTAREALRGEVGRRLNRLVRR